jgi:leucyl-tRNA synthetase
MVLNEIFFRKSGAGRIQYFNPADVDIRTDDKGQRLGVVLRSDGAPVESGGIGTMSKSKNNGVDPQALIERYGADTARFFMMFTSPPEQTLEWSDSGVEGSYRYLKRLWAFACRYADSVRPKLPAGTTLAGARLPAGLTDARREIHANLRQATFDLQRNQFNTVASACMKILNALERAPDEDGESHALVLAEGLSILLRVQSPITPHLGHHLWRELGFGDDVLTAAWPEPLEEALAQDEVELVLQVNGKLRGSMRVARDASREQLEKLALEHPHVLKFTEGQAPRKVVVVPGRLVNVVV